MLPFHYIVNELIQAGADVNCRDDLNRTPLHLACSYGQSDAVTLLLNNEADLSLKSLQGNTPFALALLAYNILQEERALQHRFDDQERVIKTLLKAGAGICTEYSCIPTGIDFANSLIIGAQFNKISLTQQLLPKAITSIEDLEKAIITKKKLAIHPDRLYKLLINRLNNPEDIQHHESLKKIKSSLRKSLVDCCISFFAQKEYRQFQNELGKILPYELGEELTNKIKLIESVVEAPSL